MRGLVSIHDSRTLRTKLMILYNSLSSNVNRSRRKSCQVSNSQRYSRVFALTTHRLALNPKSNATFSNPVQSAPPAVENVCSSMILKHQETAKWLRRLPTLLIHRRRTKLTLQNLQAVYRLSVLLAPPRCFRFQPRSRTTIPILVPVEYKGNHIQAPRTASQARPRRRIARPQFARRTHLRGWNSSSNLKRSPQGLTHWLLALIPTTCSQTP